MFFVLVKVIINDENVIEFVCFVCVYVCFFLWGLGDNLYLVVGMEGFIWYEEEKKLKWVFKVWF